MPAPPTPRVLKHAADRVLALVCCLASAPLLALLIAAIVAEDLLAGEGLCSPFYTEPRISAGRRFRLVKLRIFRPSRLRALREAAGGSIALIKEHEGERGAVSVVGELLRRFYLDELPQVWHVLLGRMSFVGPRPIPLDDDERRRLFGRCGMKAGLAGPFQLTKGSPRPMRDRDLDYYREYCRRGQVSLLVYDLGILVRTPFKMGKGEGL